MGAVRDVACRRCAAFWSASRHGPLMRDVIWINLGEEICGHLPWLRRILR
jgi:hypothetical protein